MIDRSEIAAIEERALNAWPGLQTLAVDGWLLRLAGGFTKRANSANPLAPGARFDQVLVEAEALYARHGLPAIFRLTPLAPPEADAILAERGYQRFDPSLVMTAPLRPFPADPRVELAPEPDTEWLKGFAKANGVLRRLHAAHDGVVRAIAHPAVFATLRDGPVPVGYGLAVAERGMVGLFDIVVSPAARGLGFGRVLTSSLLAWGTSVGADHAYLQVRAENSVAHRLYATLGFVERYSYHYRVPPA
jgi:GNAT superfamily N-acetyltransferase